MPELPEVETTRRGIEPHIVGKTLTGVVVRERRLRWPVPRQLHRSVAGQTVQSLQQGLTPELAALLGLSTGTVIIHLGMSGSLRILNCKTSPQKHDHVDFVFQNGPAYRRPVR